MNSIICFAIRGMLKKAPYPTHPTPAHQDAPFHGQGRSTQEAFPLFYFRFTLASLSRRSGLHEIRFTCFNVMRERSWQTFSASR